MSRWRLVFDDIADLPAINKLTGGRELDYSLTFEAPDEKTARQFAEAAASPALGRWHIELVPSPAAPDPQEPA